MILRARCARPHESERSRGDASPRKDERAITRQEAQFVYIREVRRKRRSGVYDRRVSRGRVEFLKLQVVEIPLQIPKLQLVRHIQCIYQRQ
jgi:hypothetical protein